MLAEADGPPPAPRTRDALDNQRSPGSSRGRGWLVRRALLAADVLGLGAAFVAVQFLYGLGHGGLSLFNLRTATLLYLFSLPGWLLVAKVLELYDHDEERASHTTVDDLARVVVLATLGAWTFFAGTLLVRAPEPNYPKLVAFWALAIAAITGARALARVVCRRASAYRQRALVVGADDVGLVVARKLRLHPEYGIDLVAFVDRDPPPRATDLADVPVVGATERLPELVRALDVERVIVAFSRLGEDEIVDLVRRLKRLDIQIDIVPRLYEVVGPNAEVHRLESMSLVGLPSVKLFPFSRSAKRVLDVVGAAAGLVVTAPLFALIAIAIKRDSPGSASTRASSRR